MMCRHPQKKPLTKPLDEEAYKLIEAETGITDHCLIDEAVTVCLEREAVRGWTDVPNVVRYILTEYIAIPSADGDDTGSQPELSGPEEPSSTVTVELSSPAEQSSPNHVGELHVPGCGTPAKKQRLYSGESSKIYIELLPPKQTRLCDLSSAGRVKEAPGSSRRIFVAIDGDLDNVDADEVDNIGVDDDLSSEISIEEHEEEPVGLINTGNTCWFNVVMQSMYYLPLFRTYISKGASTRSFACGNKEKRKLVVSIDQLFELMTAMFEGAPDPSFVLEEIHCVKPGMYHPSLQQDVSEFHMDLVDLLEDAFTPTNSSFAVEPNWVSNMFIGEVIWKSPTQGGHDQVERFREWNVGVNGQDDLIDSLTRRMGIEGWISQFPHVMVFNISRITFNPVTKTLEKNCQHLPFYQCIDMSRFDFQNAGFAAPIREKVLNLLKRLDKVSKDLTRLSTVIMDHPEHDDHDDPMHFGGPAHYIRGHRIRGQFKALVEERDKISHALFTAYMEFNSNCSVRKTEYLLHAVIVHHGPSTTNGHYVVYINKENFPTGWWLYIDDQYVNVTPWDVVQYVGYGGASDAGAFCLVYKRM